MNNFIKVCGITNLDDLELLTTLDVDAVGFNLYEKSKRFIDIHHVKKLVEKLPEKYLIVLIFVNHEKDFVSDCLKQIPNAIPQFHGDESREYCESFEKEYIKAIRINSDTDLEKINDDFKDAKMLIFDSFDEQEYGGTGRTFDLNLLEDKVRVPYLVAGGINESNFQSSLNLENCIGIDVCSSVEEEPGIKDHSKVKNLVEKVRSFHV